MILVFIRREPVYERRVGGATATSDGIATSKAVKGDECRGSGRKSHFRLRRALCVAASFVEASTATTSQCSVS